MIAAFCGMEKEDALITQNLIAAGLALTVCQKKDVILVESAFGDTKIEEAVHGILPAMIQEPFSYMEGVGMDYLMKRSQYDMLGEASVKGGIVPVNSRLSYVPCAVRRNRRLYEEEFERECANILMQLDKIADFVFVDCREFSDNTGHAVMEAADVIIVNVSQSETVLEEYFSMPSRYRSKSLFCIGNYIQEEPCNLKNIQRMYRIEGGEIGVIPYNTEFLSSLKKGKAVSFFSSYPVRARSYRNKDFFRESFRMADLIMQWEGCDAGTFMDRNDESCRQNADAGIGTECVDRRLNPVCG